MGKDEMWLNTELSANLHLMIQTLNAFAPLFLLAFGAMVIS
jgi:hypothetical protein